MKVSKELLVAKHETSMMHRISIDAFSRRSMAKQVRKQEQATCAAKILQIWREVDAR
jgi:uncharacterized protein (DUF2384 family)